MQQIPKGFFAVTIVTQSPGNPHLPGCVRGDRVTFFAGVSEEYAKIGGACMIYTSDGNYLVAQDTDEIGAMLCRALMD